MNQQNSNLLLIRKYLSITFTSLCWLVSWFMLLWLVMAWPSLVWWPGLVAWSGGLVSGLVAWSGSVWLGLTWSGPVWPTAWPIFSQFLI